MKSKHRYKNQFIARVIGHFPSYSKRLIDAFTFMVSKDIPWTPVTKLLRDSKIALVTTAGVHHKDQKPFDMNDTNGDPTYRTIDSKRLIADLMITHDYYDHRDADKDINIVFPLERLKEFERAGYIGTLAEKHYGFMGHIVGQHTQTLIKRIAPEVAMKLKRAHVDIVLLTPG